MKKKRTKKKSLKYIEIPLRIYGRSVVVFFGTTLEEIVKISVKKGIPEEYFSDAWKQDMKCMLGSGASGFTIHLGIDRTDILVWLRERPRKLSRYAALMHELSHAVDFIAFDTDDQEKWYGKNGMSEPRAYLMEHLFTECCKILW